MKPILNLLSEKEEARIIGEGIALLENPGVVIHQESVLALLEAAGARVDYQERLASLSAELIETALASAPKQFSLFNLRGVETVRYGQGQTQFNPGSSALAVLDSQTKLIRPVTTADLARFVQLVEVLPSIDAQSTAMVCSEVPEPIQDLYRLYVALNFQTKPIVTGIFRAESWQVMKELLDIAAGSSQELRDKPVAVFDICPTSPLGWSRTSSQNLLDNARSGIPVQIISMPMAGATAPVTLAGTLVQHTAECLSGVVISQAANPGAPVVWGGSAAVFDMKHSLAPLGAPGTWLLACGYAQIGRSLGLPTQGYLGLSDAKLMDAQAGMESASGALLGTLAGFEMISGAGMLAFENCQSPEKLVLDAEIISQVKHFARGIEIREEPLGLDLIRAVGHQGDFISQEHTYRWFKEEVHYPSQLIDRQTPEDWKNHGSKDAWSRAQERAAALLASYPGPALDAPTRKELRRITSQAAREAGLEELPPLLG